MINENKKFRLLKLASVAALIAVAATMTSCAARPDRQTTSGIPDDYRTRHPITLAEVQHNLDVPVGTGERRLNTGTRDLIRGFVQDYAALSSGTMLIAVPSQSANAGKRSHQCRRQAEPRRHDLL
jgi:pilus assembly protein CpaD